MRGLALATAAPLVLVAVPAGAQQADHAHHQHGMEQMQAPPETDHASHAAAGSVTTADPADTPGNAAPPPVPADHPADRFFPADRMARARAALVRESDWRGSALLIDELEYRAQGGADGYAWKVTGWTGGDINRLAISTEGEGEIGGGVEHGEVRALWRHALDPWFNLEAGLRQDFGHGPQRTYATLGIEGLAPYWFELEGQVFVSNKGDVHLRAGGSHDLRLSGPLLLQPEAEVNVALQDVPELGIGAGFERIELGARLRYEIRPEFAPYVGVHWESRLGGSADLARARRDRVSGVSAVAGLRAWF